MDEQGDRHPPRPRTPPFRLVRFGKRSRKNGRMGKHARDFVGRGGLRSHGRKKGYTTEVLEDLRVRHGHMGERETAPRSWEQKRLHPGCIGGKRPYRCPMRPHRSRIGGNAAVLGQTAAPQSHRKNSEPVRGRGKSPASSGRPNPGRHLAGHAGGRRDAAGGVGIGSVERLTESGKKRPQSGIIFSRLK